VPVKFSLDDQTYPVLERVAKQKHST